MKKILFVIFALVLAIGLSACTKDGQGVPATGNDEAVADGAANPEGAPDEMGEKGSEADNEDHDHDHAQE